MNSESDDTVKGEAVTPTKIGTQNDTTMTGTLQELSCTVSKSARKRWALKIHANLARGHLMADVYLHGVKQIENDPNYD